MQSTFDMALKNNEWRLEILHQIEEEKNDSIDVVVYDADGLIYTATLFTLKNIETLLERWRSTGECLNGKYFWAADMLIVEKLTVETIESVVDGLIESGEFYSVFSGPSNL